MRLARAFPLVLLLALFLVHPAAAHALLVRSSPEADAEMLVAPSTIEMWFSEPLEAAFTGARLIGPDGNEVPSDRAVVDPSDSTHVTLPLGNLGPGIYTIAWQTLSQVDGHEWYGSFPITVLNPDGSAPAPGAVVVSDGGRGDLPTAGEIATRWLALSGSMLLFGGLAFLWLIVPNRATPALRSHTMRTIAVVLMVSLVAVIVGSLGQAVLQSFRLGGLPELPQLIVGTRTGSLVLARILLALAGMALISRFGPPVRRQRIIWLTVGSLSLLVSAMLVVAAVEGEAVLSGVAILLGLGSLTVAASDRGERYRGPAIWLIASTLLVSFSISSHAGAVQGSLFAVLGDFIHLVAAASWVGGLVLLPLLWVRAHDQGLNDDLVIAVRRFSVLAGASVFVILLTGLFNSLVEIPDLQSLWSTPYGLMLLTKIALVLMALFVAFLNNRRVRGSVDSESLPSQIAFETGLAAVILVAVAVLVQTPTPRSLAIPEEPISGLQPFNQIAPTDDINVHVQVDPNQAGKNRFWVHLYHDDSSEIGEVQLVRLFFEHSEQEMGRASVDLEPLGQDTFAAEGAFLSQSGPWDLSVYVRRRGIDDLLSDVKVEVAEGASSQQSTAAIGNPIPQLAPQTIFGGLLVVVGSVPILWRRQLRGNLARSYVVGIVLVVVGSAAFVQGVAKDTLAEIPLIQRTNPVLPTSDSIAQGEADYIESCLLCHGSTGLGDGPVGVTLIPRPANLAVHMVPGVHSDGQILEWVSNGFPNSSMPAFSGTYDEEQLWHLINYIRTFGNAEEE